MKISIVTVCYNSEKTIQKTFESILEQSYEDYEYIVVDGKSTDNTLKIIKEYEQKFGTKMKWLSEKDSGIYDAMNKGIKICTGDIIAILNSDDYYLKNTLEDIQNFFEKNEEKIVSGEIEIIDNNDNILKKYCNNDNYIKDLKKRMCINHPATFIKKEIYEKEGSFDTTFRIAGDYDFISRLVNKGYDIKFIDKPLVRMLNEGISNNKKFYDILYNENKRIRKKYYGNKSAFIWGIRDKISFIKKRIFNA